ncbi:MAG: STAS domain-containing protein [Chthoniobacteraceae bacterium]|nr:STAS domain-containing protein [Chthoniobacteraceae bacterium]
MSTQSSILVGCSNKVVWVRVEGKGSFLNSSGLKEFARAMINRGHREFVVDLLHCPVMDSTFMGTLAGIALRLREIGQGALHVIHLNERNGDLLRNLGLDRLFALDLCGIAPLGGEPAVKTEPIETDAAVDRTAQAKTMLEAHEALVEVAPGNLTKFKDVLEYLKQDLAHPE